MNSPEELSPVVDPIHEMITWKLMNQQMLTEIERQYQQDPASVDVSEIGKILTAFIEAPFVGFVGWQEPHIPKENLLPVKQFGYELLPESLRGWIKDAAYRLNDTPPDLIAASAMCALCSLVGKRVGIYPKRKDDWLNIPNLWGAGVDAVGRNKTGKLSEGTRFLRELNVEARQYHDDVMLDYSVDVEVHSLAEAAAKKPNKGKLDVDAVKATLRELRDSKPEMPPRRRYIVTDVTVEKLSIIQSENPMGVLVLRDELTGWLRSISREDHSEDRSYYLTGWNGTESWETDRISRAEVNVPSHVIAVFGGIQPDKLRGYLRAMADGGGNDGLIQRFQLLVYPDTHKPTPVDAAPNLEARVMASEVFKNIDAIPCHDGYDTPAVRFDDGAYESFWHWYGNLLERVDSEVSTHVAAHLSKYASLCPSLALVIELAETASEQVPDIENLTVSDKSVSMAIAWCTYLETHARRIYAMVDDPLSATRALLGRLYDMEGPFTIREVVRKGWSGLPSTEVVRDAADRLVEFNCLAREDIQTKGRTATKYHVNPRINPDE